MIIVKVPNFSIRAGRAINFQIKFNIRRRFDVAVKSLFPQTSVRFPVSISTVMKAIAVAKIWSVQPALCYVMKPSQLFKFILREMGKILKVSEIQKLFSSFSLNPKWVRERREVNWPPPNLTPSIEILNKADDNEIRSKWTRLRGLLDSQWSSFGLKLAMSDLVMSSGEERFQNCEWRFASHLCSFNHTPKAFRNGITPHEWVAFVHIVN